MVNLETRDEIGHMGSSNFVKYSPSHSSSFVHHQLFVVGFVGR